MCCSFSVSPEDPGLADSHPLQPAASGYTKWIQTSDELSQEEEEKKKKESKSKPYTNISVK